MKYVRSLLVIAALALLPASHASAASLAFPLDCVFSGLVTDGSCVASGSFGTVVLSDNAVTGAYLDINVDLSPGFFITGLYLNAPTTWTNGADPTRVVIGGTTYVFEEAPVAGSQISIQPRFAADNQGLNYLYFDLEVRGDKPSTDPWFGSIRLREDLKANTFFDLSPFTFANITNDPQAGLPAPTALVYLAVSRGPTAEGGPTSLVGATSVVPEPASLFLLGSGVSWLGLAVRRRSRNRNSA